MAITQSQSINPASARQRVQGAYLDSAADPAAAALTPGFKPRYVCLENATDRIKYEWYEGMAAGTTIKTVAAGTRTLDTADAAISVDSTTGVITFGDTPMIQNKQYYWVAEQ